ncbi:MAG: A/G-specific adenine glycosylase [Nonlabens sp.]|nr:A/G-specific adenine glycosylase [Nonlabens sp.]
MNFSKRLQEWYFVNKRDLPWRSIQDPYFIWLSEVILQQTRVEQGMPYYYAFTKAFPTVQELAAAPQEQVLKLWQGLGYYSRARNLHTAAQQVGAMGGNFPKTYKELLSLKGVGDYTAAAIASFSYNEAVPVVDGNVYRVLSRIYGIATPINSTAGIKEFKALAVQLLDISNPGTHNQAIMEFGALHCKPANPFCETCPFNDQCVAHAQNRTTELPVKLKSKPVTHLYHHYLVVRTPLDNTLLVKRPQQGIWAGLYEFPYIEASKTLECQELQEQLKSQEWLSGVRFRESVTLQHTAVHKLSHRTIHATFWEINTLDEVNDSVHIKDAFEKPVHVLMDRYMKSQWNAYL